MSLGSKHRKKVSFYLFTEAIISLEYSFGLLHVYMCAFEENAWVVKNTLLVFTPHVPVFFFGLAGVILEILCLNFICCQLPSL